MKRTMSCTQRLGGLALITLLSAMPASVIGQAQDGQRGRVNRAVPALTNAQLVTMLDAYAIVEAQKVLELSDEQYGQFVARLKRLQDTRRRNMQARNKLLQELRRMTAPDVTTDAAALQERIKALRAFDEQAAQALTREHAAVDEVLDTRQQARFLLFEERLEHQKLDLLMRARERAARNALQRRPDGTK
jgi:hypothetical protein